MWKKIFLAILFAVAAFSEASPDRRIVGGQNVALGQLPYMASIRSMGSTTHFAGGVIISSRWILSNAHFLSGFAHTALHIVMGIVDLEATGISRRSELIEIHPGFVSEGRINDIACVRMMLPALTFSPTLSVINMDDNPVMNNEIGTTAGWGSINENMAPPNHQFLQRLQVIIQPCVEVTTITTLFPTVVTPAPTGPPGVPTAPLPTTTQPTTTPNPNPSKLCTIPFSHGGICTSDVGGPLVTLFGLVGIASWHPVPCGSGRDMFEPIRGHREWIRSTTGV